MNALHIIGLGLSLESITLKGKQLVQQSDYVYLENYTSIPNYEINELEQLLDVKIIPLNRNDVESEDNKIINQAQKNKVSLLILGDIFAATTHQDIYTRALEKRIPVELENNASIFNHIGNCGIDQYKFGRVTSLVFTQDNWFPSSPYDNIADNQKIGLHTACLLDIKTAEPTKEDLLKGINKPQKARFMTSKEAIEYLQKADKLYGKNVLPDHKKIISISRAGAKNQKIFFDTPNNLKSKDFGLPLHTLIIPGNLSHYEEYNIKTIVNHQNLY